MDEKGDTYYNKWNINLLIAPSNYNSNYNSYNHNSIDIKPKKRLIDCWAIH